MFNLYGVNHVVCALADFVKISLQWADPWCPLGHQGHRQNIDLGRSMASEVGLEAIGARSKARLGPAHSHLETMWCLVCTETRLTFLCWRHGINPFLFSWTEQDENQGQKFWFEGMCFFPQITSILFLFPIRSEHHFCLHASEVRTLHVDRT